MPKPGRFIDRQPILAAALAIPLVIGLRNGATDATTYDVSDAGPASAALPAIVSGLTGGDTLTITFYETVGSQGESSTPNLSGVVERPEMNGQYVVQLDGTIYVPFVGMVNVSGLKPEALQKKLEGQATSLFQRPVKTIVRLVKREPIYVTGSVPQPGTFEYRPGMTVLHAMILAGMRTGDPLDAGRIDILQETERLRKSDVMIADLIARRDVIVALRDGRNPQPSRALTKLVGHMSAERRIEAAGRLAEMEAAKEKGDQDGIGRVLAAIQKQRGLLLKSTKDAEAALEHASSRFNIVSNTRNRGLITQSSFDQAQSDLDSARARLNDIRSSLTHLEERAIELRHKRASAIADVQIARQREIDTLQASIARTAITRDTLAPVLGFTSTAYGSKTTSPRVKILRRSQSGMTKLDVTELSPVEPGDIIEIFKPVPTVSLESPDAVHGDSRDRLSSSGVPDHSRVR
jgi:protein involved in polysaccharide export with SLBB domain